MGEVGDFAASDEDGWRAKAIDIEAIAVARHADPFAILGPHLTRAGWAIRAFAPDAIGVKAVARNGAPLAELVRRSGDFFEALTANQSERPAYRLELTRADGVESCDDPYAFGPVLGPLDEHLLVEGSHRQLYMRLGAQLTRHEGVDGVAFAVWAPHAKRVSVVGDFNRWDGRRTQMRKRLDSGLWEVFVPGLSAGAVYKYEILGVDGVLALLKADPFGYAAEMRPSTASVVADTAHFQWSDADHLERRRQGEPRRKPMAILEVHLGSWRRGPDNRFLTYDELADELIPYATDLGFTHLELMPITEHPLDELVGLSTDRPVRADAPPRRAGWVCPLRRSRPRRRTRNYPRLGSRPFPDRRPRARAVRRRPAL